MLAAVKEEILDTGRFDPATEIRPYTITTPDIGETLLLPRVVARLAQEAPRVNLRSVVVRPRHLEEALEAGEVDLAVGYFPDLARPTTMQQRLFNCGSRRRKLIVQSVDLVRLIGRDILLMQPSQRATLGAACARIRRMSFLERSTHECGMLPENLFTA